MIRQCEFCREDSAVGNDFGDRACANHITGLWSLTAYKTGFRLSGPLGRRHAEKTRLQIAQSG